MAGQGHNDDDRPAASVSRQKEERHHTKVRYLQKSFLDPRVADELVPPHVLNQLLVSGA